MLPESSTQIVCEHAGRCGGCPMIGLAYGDQLVMKRGRVLAAAARYDSLESRTVEPTLAATPISDYRARAKLVVAPGGRLGLYAKGGGHDVVDIPNCRVLAPRVAEVASFVRTRIAEEERRDGILAPLSSRGRGALRAVDLREVVNGDLSFVLLTLVIHEERLDREAIEREARAWAADCDAILGVAINIHRGDSPQILGKETSVACGASSAPDHIGAVRHEATYGSFVQAHRGQARCVHELVIDGLGITPGCGSKVLDLYGGSGAIALALAASGASVSLVESFPPAVAQAQRAAVSQGLAIRAEVADVATALRRFVERREPVDAAVVNPPRRGLSPLVRELLARLGVARIAYVSCDPDTLARDLDHLTRLGYVVEALKPLDMIPLTEEVETVALLRRASIPPPPVVYEDEEILVVDKGAHEPTVPQREYATSLLGRVRSLPNAAEAVPIHRSDAGMSGLVVFARSPAISSRWRDTFASETTRQVFVVGARGVTPSKGAITRELREAHRVHPARTRFRRLAVASGHSVLRVIPEQRAPRDVAHEAPPPTHQLRRHLAAIGHPVLGDERYGHPPTNRFFEEKNGLDRSFVHCVRIEFEHPTTGQRMIVEAPLPGELRAVLERTSGPATLKFLDQKNALGLAGPSSLPPPPLDSDASSEESERALDVDASSPTIRPEATTDDDR